VERCQGVGCTTFSPIGSVTGTTYSDSSLAGETDYSYQARATDAAGNLGPYSSVASATTLVADTTPPSAPGNLTAAPMSGSRIDLIWDPAIDDIGVTGYFVERCQGVGCTTFSPIGSVTGTTYSDSSLAGETDYSYQVRATDEAGNLGPYSNVASATTLTGGTPIPGLVAAYSFNEGTGPTVGDASGNGNTGTINGATWTTAGKYGGALSFNGSSNYVDLGNPPSLHITGSMTWSAWIYATGTPADDGQIIAKSGDGGGNGGWQFKTSPDTGPHTFGVGISADGNANTQRYSTTVRSLNTWYHVAGVYDAAAQTLDIYVNGVLDNGVLQGSVPVAQFDSAENVTIGRRTGGFYFQGTIDEVQIYNRALTPAEIQTIMNTGL
jgi:chitodextrinase